MRNHKVKTRYGGGLRAEHRRSLRGYAWRGPGGLVLLRQRRRGAEGRRRTRVCTPAITSGGISTIGARPTTCPRSWARSPSRSCTGWMASACPCGWNASKWAANRAIRSSRACAQRASRRPSRRFGPGTSRNTARARGPMAGGAGDPRHAGDRAGAARERRVRAPARRRGTLTLLDAHGRATRTLRAGAGSGCRHALRRRGSGVGRDGDRRGRREQRGARIRRGEVAQPLRAGARTLREGSPRAGAGVMSYRGS